MKETKHIVFFTATLNRTGSEIVLLNLLKKINFDGKITVISKFKGELYDQIPDGITKFHLYGRQYGNLFDRIYNKFRQLLFVNSILNKHIKAVWYINTIVLPDALEFCESNRIKTTIHTHELKQMYDSLNEKQIKRLVNYPTQIIANSNSSAEVLKGFGRNDKIDIVYPSLNQELLLKSNFIDLRLGLNIKNNQFVWMMCGTLDENKNPLLFIKIASELKKYTTNFKMIWLGGITNNSELELQCQNLMNELGVKENSTFINDVKDKFYDYFSLANGFVLTSEFESFSMTTLEALYFQIPVVANDCVGVNEILVNKYGYVVKQKNNAKEFADKMWGYMNGELKFDKKELRNRALEFQVEDIAYKWNEIINREC